MIEIMSEGVKDLGEVLEASPMTKYYFYRKARERANSPHFPHKICIGDMSTSLMLPDEVHLMMKPLVRKYGYRLLDDIAQEYLTQNPIVQSLR